MYSADIHPIFPSKAPRTIPNANSLIEGGGNDEVLLGVELGAHDVVVVARHGAEQRAVLPVPYPNRLVVTSTNNPRELVVEEDGANVVQVAVKGKEAAPSLERPDLDLVVVTARYEERLWGICVSYGRYLESAHRGNRELTCVLWKSTPLTGPSCSSNRSIRVPMR